MKKKLFSLAGCACALALGGALLAGCSSNAASSASGSASAESYEPLSIAYLNKGGYEDIIVADNQGFYKDCGPEITLNPVTGSGAQSVEALLSGASDIAATGQGPVADALKNYGDRIVVLAGTNISTGGQVWVAGAGMTGDKALVPFDKAKDNKAEVAASFQSAAAANGGTIKCGVQKGATTESEFKSWLKKMGISFNDFGTEGDGVVTLVDLKANTIPTALVSGDIDMMAASQPYPDTALKQIDGSYKVGCNADVDSYGVATLITTKEVYEQKEASIKAFLQAEKKSVDFMNSNADEAMKICADSIGTDLDAQKATWDIANFRVDMSDQKIAALKATCAKKGLEITEEQLKAQAPLAQWCKDTLNK